MIDQDGSSDPQGSQRAYEHQDSGTQTPPPTPSPLHRYLPIDAQIRNHLAPFSRAVGSLGAGSGSNVSCDVDSQGFERHASISEGCVVIRGVARNAAAESLILVMISSRLGAPQALKAAIRSSSTGVSDSEGSVWTRALPSTL